MRTFGFMTLHLTSEHSYVTGIAKAAHRYGVTCYRFVPTNIQPGSEIVVGEIYNPDQDGWEQTEFPIPTCIYDRCFYGSDAHSRRCASIVKWMKEKPGIHFLGYGLPNKMETYQALAKTKLQPYLLPSTLVTSPEQVLSTLNVINPAIMKPIDGSGGAGIYLLKKESDQLIVETDKRGEHIRRTFESFDGFTLWMQSLLKKRLFLIQPYKQLTTKLGEPFDLRTLLQKDAAGLWKQSGQGIRVGTNGSLVSNLAAGGHVTRLTEWLTDSGLSENSFIFKEINYILTLLPKVLEESFRPLFELGVDIGMAKDGSLWILDVNSKPGRKVVLETAEDQREALYQAPILYANHLMTKERSVGRHEEIVSNRN